jgi:hypothetical protein
VASTCAASAQACPSVPSTRQGVGCPLGCPLAVITGIFGSSNAWPDNSAGSAAAFQGHNHPWPLLPAWQSCPPSAELGADLVGSPGSFVLRFLSGGCPLGPAPWHPE